MRRLALNESQRPAPLRVGFYIRTATIEQATHSLEDPARTQEHSLRHQLEVMNQESYLGEITHVLIDRAHSGRNAHRPAFQQLVSLIGNGQIDLLLTTDRSRISRNIQDFVSFQRFMQDHDCRFLCLSDARHPTVQAVQQVLS